ncbi:MAG TPA: sulfatase-like hydrolase/transferase [Vicinamibacteria bacterium]|nr:sulfatase-like hydrolase/transferase [Vicinamibacteria bacterium]
MRIPLLVGLLAAAACGRGEAPAPAPAPPRSVLLVTVDTLRADRLGAYGDARARTPVLDGLAAAGTLFENAYTPAPLTLPAHASLMTGLVPPAHGVRGNGTFALGPGIPTLAEVMRARGLATAAFVGGFPLVRRFGLARGFDHYDDAMGKPAGVGYDLAERRADAVVGSARAWLAGRPGPVFVWVHVFDPHAPYDPPPAFRDPDPYRGEVAATDAALGELMRAWDARAEPSLVVVTSDHGEAFGEHGEESHSLFVYDTTLRVPLLVRGPGWPAGGRRAPAVGLVDVPATIVEAMGPGPGLPGRSLREAPEAGAGRALYAEAMAPRLDFGWSDLRAWRDGRYKFVRAPRPELYDLRDDPGETRDLAAARPDLVARLRQGLDEALAASGEAESRRGPDPDAAERLRALGYVQGPEARGSGADPKDMLDVALLIARATGPFRDHAAAAAAYRPIAQRDPANPLVNLRLADALLRSGRAEESIRHYERVIAGHPRTADAHVGLASAHAERGRLDQARTVLRQALAVDPTNGQVRYNLAEVARVGGDLATARREYTAALDDPVTRERARARLQALP